MDNKPAFPRLWPVFLLLLLSSCSVGRETVREPNQGVPARYPGASDTAGVAQLNWREYFSDSLLIALIDTALDHNQELQIILQDIRIDENEIRARKGEYLPFVHVGVASGLEKEGRFTRKGAVDEQLTIKDGRPFPEPFGDFMLRASAGWEVDIWKKLRNARKSAVMKYLASIEGRNFMVTNLVAEIAEAYYELQAWDNLLVITDQFIDIQSSALQVVRLQKESAKVTQLAVNRFEAQLLHTRNLQFEIRQRIAEKENRLYFLTAGASVSVGRVSAGFLDMAVDSIPAGVPAQLLMYRPDVRQAERALQAAKLDVQVARANFYPSLSIAAGFGFQAFNPVFLLLPESMLYNAAGDLMAPVINRNAIKAAYYSASARQLQAVYQYEQTILLAYVDVLNQLSKVANYRRSCDTKQKEVDILNQSVLIAGNLFNSARADYSEVLLTQREALEAKMELIVQKMNLVSGKVNLYRALGGGWQ